MARYYFHTLDGDCIRDDLGEELPDDDAAREEALVVFGELLQHHGPQFWTSRRFSIIATNESRDIVVTLTAEASDDLPDDPRAQALIN